MRIQVVLLSLVLSVFSSASLAGSGHDHGHSHDPVTQSQVEDVAIKNVVRLVDEGKIDKSWGPVPVMNSEKKKFGDNTEWVVTFRNETIGDTTKQTLYVFVTMDGHYLAANYTGK